MNKTHPSSGRKSGKSKIIWSIAFLFIAALSIWSVTSMMDNFSFAALFDKLAEMPLIYIIGAAISMLGFIIFEALALMMVLRALGYKRGLRKSFIYSASDIYFSAITPSATGGQPASAYFMIKDSIPGSAATLSLVVNLVAYTASMIILGLLSLIIFPQGLLVFGTPSKILIGFGYIVQLGLLISFVLLIKKGNILYKFGGFLINLLHKLRIIRKKEKLMSKLEKVVGEYDEHSKSLGGKHRPLITATVFNLLQRVSVIAVTLFIYLGSGGSASKLGEIFSLQSQTIIGAYCIPIPGAMGVTDYLMLDGFSSLMAEDAAICLELVSRSISFYSCIIICGITVLFKYVSLRRKLK